jgi:hypothetical protein
MKDSTKKYLVLNQDGEYEYDIHVKTTKKGVRYTLFNSNSEIWNSGVKGEEILSMTNTGDGVIFDKKMKALDYSQLAELRILLGFENASDTKENRDDFKIIPVTDTIKLKR